MKFNGIIIGVLLCCFFLGGCMNRLHTQTESVAADRLKEETKVVESRENGQYKRVTEVFIDDALFSRKTEVSVKDNGKFDLVHTTYFQGGKKTLFSTVDGNRRVVTHSYLLDDKVMMMECDENGDALFETIVLFDDKGNPATVFKRDKKGMVVPLCEEELSEWMEINWDELLE
jgi:hypothetical protein